MPGVHKRLHHSTVGIAGGRLGSTLAVALARIGIFELIIVDYDLVEHPTCLTLNAIKKITPSRVWTFEQNWIIFAVAIVVIG